MPKTPPAQTNSLQSPEISAGAKADKFFNMTQQEVNLLKMTENSTFSNPWMNHTR
jgi:hypothetical protein